MPGPIVAGEGNAALEVLTFCSRGLRLLTIAPTTSASTVFGAAELPRRKLALPIRAVDDVGLVKTVLNSYRL